MVQLKSRYLALYLSLFFQAHPVKYIDYLWTWESQISEHIWMRWSLLSIGVDKRTEEDKMFFSFLVVICESCKMLTCECTWVAISRTYLYRLAIFPKLETFRVLINKGNWEDEVVSISKWCNLWFVSKGRSNIWLWVI